METELTIAARSSVENAGQIVENQNEFEEKDFAKTTQKPKKKQTQNIKKARKSEAKERQQLKKAT